MPLSNFERLELGYMLLREGDDSVGDKDSEPGDYNDLHAIRMPRDRTSARMYFKGQKSIRELAITADSRGLVNRNSVLGYVIPENLFSKRGGLSH